MSVDVFGTFDFPPPQYQTQDTGDSVFDTSYQAQFPRIEVYILTMMFQGKIRLWNMVPCEGYMMFIDMLHRFVR